MLCSASSGSSFGNIFELLGLVVIFILILIATYYCTRWIGKNAYIHSGANNIEVIETFRLSQSKYIQILKIGSAKYTVIAVSKDSVEYLGDISEEDLDLLSAQTGHDNMPGFAEILKRISKKTK